MLRFEKIDTALVVTFADPEGINALGLTEYEALVSSLSEAAQQQNVTAVLIRSEGRVFCAGNKLAEFQSDWPQPVDGLIFKLFETIEALPIPVVAAVQGGAVGVGATLLLHSDIVIMSDAAFLRYPFLQVGITPEGGSTRLLPQLVGKHRAAEIFFSCRRVLAKEALSLGLASHVVSKDDLEKVSMDWLKKIAELPGSAAVRTKALMRGGNDSNLPKLFQEEIGEINTLILEQRKSPKKGPKKGGLR